MSLWMGALFGAIGALLVELTVFVDATSKRWEQEQFVAAGGVLDPKEAVASPADMLDSESFMFGFMARVFAGGVGGLVFAAVDVVCVWFTAMAIGALTPKLAFDELWSTILPPLRRMFR